MDLLRRLLRGRGQRGPADNALHLYVRCGRCGAPVHVRIHLLNDLTVEYDDNEQVSGYRLRKEIMDARCFRLIYAELTFDPHRREVSRSIKGGEFISQEDYARLSAPSAGAS